MRLGIAGAVVTFAITSIVTAKAQTTAPPVVSAVDWTGFYAGVELGADFSKLPGSISVAPTPGGVVPLLPRGQSPPIARATLNLANNYDGSIAGGGQIGYNWQLFNGLILGGELDFRGDGNAVMTAHSNLPPFVNQGDFVLGDNFKSSTQWNGSARLKLGYPWGALLPYVTGGIAFADVNISSNFVATPLAFANRATSASASDTLVGWTAGAGLEYSLNPSWSIGAEYRYADYGSTNVNLGTLITFEAGSGVVKEPVSAHVGVQEHSIMLKLNYHFNTPL